MLVIPAVDIRGGKCVRLREGRPEAETIYGEDPVAMALRWEREGAARIHVVDLDAALGEGTDNRDAILGVLAALTIPVQVGGGVRDAARAEAWLAAGAARVVVGTRAIEEPAFLASLARAHPGRISLGLDARGGKAALRGWKESSARTVAEVLRGTAGLPLGEVVLTAIARDGTLEGPDLAALREALAASPHPVIASGGVGSAGDVRALAALGAFGCILGVSLYAGRLTLAEALAAAAP